MAMPATRHLLALSLAIAVGSHPLVAQASAPVQDPIKGIDAIVAHELE